jgi:hypothetical protein
MMNSELAAELADEAQLKTAVRELRKVQKESVTGTGKLIHVGTEELIHLDEGIMAALSGDGLVRGIHADQDIAQAGQEPSRHCL